MTEEYAKSFSSEIIDGNHFANEERLLYSIDAERGFLGCLIRDPNLIVEADQQVRADMLNVDEHRYIYGVMLGIYKKASERGWELTFTAQAMVQVARSMGADYEERFYHRTEHLNKVRQLESVAQAISLSDFTKFVDDIKERNAKIELWRQGRLAMLAAINGRGGAGDIALEAEERFARIAASTQSGENRLEPISMQENENLIKSYFNWKRPDLSLYNTPIHKYPRLMSILGGGYRRRGTTMLFARPKVGKTTFIINQLIGAAEQGWPALLMDNEMGREAMYSRELASLSGWREQDLIAGKMFAEGEDVTAIHLALEKLRNLPFYYVNVANKPASFIALMLRQFRNIVGYEELMIDEFENHDHYETFGHLRGIKMTFSRPSLAAFDWFKINEDQSKGKSSPEHQQIGYLMQSIKTAVSEFDLALMAGAQHNREGTQLRGHDRGLMSDSASSMSDRFNMFCDCKIDLWKLHPEEVAAAVEAFGARTTSTHDMRMQPLYNQLATVSNNRHGANCVEGVPFFHNFGKFIYEEINDDHTTSLGRKKQDISKFINELPDRLSEKKKGGGREKGSVDGLKNSAAAAAETGVPA